MKMLTSGSAQKRKTHLNFSFLSGLGTFQSQKLTKTNMFYYETIHNCCSKKMQLGKTQNLFLHAKINKK